MHIPDRYVTSVNERLNLYNKINDLNDIASLNAFEEELQDRFGQIPISTRELSNLVKLKWVLQSLNIEKASIKRGRLKCHFYKRADEKFFEGQAFGNIVEYVQKNHPRASLQQEARRHCVYCQGHYDRKRSADCF